MKLIEEQEMLLLTRRLDYLKSQHHRYIDEMDYLHRPLYTDVKTTEALIGQLKNLKKDN